MGFIQYQDISFNSLQQRIINQANAIIENYQKMGYDLTLRQLYYRFVAGDLFPKEWADKETGSTNNERSYKKLGDIIANARLAGLIDWDAITDRTRNLRKRAEWDQPQDLLEVCANQFRIDCWEGQPYRVEVWVEKDALVGLLEDVCERNGVAYFSCRGYTSASELHVAAMRILRHLKSKQQVVVLHLGDHDPSGIDMTRDIEERLSLFIDHHYSGPSSFTVKRIALNMPQIQQYDPPPNPAKVTDSRANAYIAKHGPSSWELDALEPAVITALIEENILRLRNTSLWAARCKEETAGRGAFQALADRYPDVVEFLNKEE